MIMVSWPNPEAYQVRNNVQQFFVVMYVFKDRMNHWRQVHAFQNWFGRIVFPLKIVISVRLCHGGGPGEAKEDIQCYDNGNENATKQKVLWAK